METNKKPNDLIVDLSKVENTSSANTKPVLPFTIKDVYFSKSDDGQPKKTEDTLPVESEIIKGVLSQVNESLINDDKNIDVVKEISEKPLDVVNIEDAKSKVSDLVVFGNGDAWELLCKASSKEQGWMKSTKVMEIGKKGIMMQVTTEFRVNGVVTSCAEAIQFLEGVRIQRDGNGKIEKLY